MTTSTYHPTPSWRAVLAAELPPPHPLRGPALVVLPAMVLGFTGLLWWVLLPEGDVDFRALWVLGAMNAWKAYGDRRYHGSLPVPRSAHALLIAVARLVQLILIFAVAFVLPLALAALLHGGRSALAALPAVVWFGPAVAGAIAFLVVYAVTLRTDRPGVWLAVGFLAFVAAKGLQEVGVLLPAVNLVDGAVRTLLFALGVERALPNATESLWWMVAGLWAGVAALGTAVSAALLREH
jgi:hypothetical protein